MAHKRTLQTTFIAGELAPELALRIDTKQYANGAKSLLNRRCLIGGGTARRPGTRHLQFLNGFIVRLIDFVFSENDQLILSFYDGAADIWGLDGTYFGTIGGCPWTGPIIRELDFMQSGNTVIVTHFTFPSFVMTRLNNALWTIHNIQFFPSGPRLEQPYYKLAPSAIQMQPLGYDGTIFVNLDFPYFQPGIVGQRIRYLGREMEVVAWHSAQQISATVIERLPPTFNLAVVDSGVFTVGEVVAGADSGAKAVVVSVSFPDALQVYAREASITSPSGTGGSTTPIGNVVDAISSFQPGVIPQPSLQGFTVGETLVGPVGTSKITAVALEVNFPAYVKDWDEALFTPVNGYPSCVTLHRNRLCFAGHPKVPNLLLASRIGNIYSFNIGDGSDADAIAVTIGDSSAAEIRQMYSSDQLILGTDKGLYYVPEGANSPFRPSSISFIAFGSPWPISGSCKMRAFDDGVIAVSGSTVIKAKGTGDSNKTWTATEMSILSPHLLNNPYDMAVTTNFEGGPERYCVFSNGDGSLAVMMLVEGQDIRNFVRWSTTGSFGSVVVAGRRLYVETIRVRNGIGVAHLELFDTSLTLDGARLLLAEHVLADIPIIFPGKTVNVVTTSGFSLGTWPLAMDDIPPGPYWAGEDYVTIIETLPAAIENSRGASIGEMARITEALVFTHESCRFTGNGYEKQAYLVNEDANLPPPRRTGPQRLKVLGWRRDPTLTILQPDPLPLTVLAIKTEICW